VNIPWLGDWNQHINAILDSLIATILYVGFQLRDPIVRGVRILWHSLVVLVTQRRYILVWNDVDPSHSARLVSLLANAFPDCRFSVLERISELSNFHLGPSNVCAVVLIDTDVSKLAPDVRVARRLERRLIRYLMRGGGIVGTHDIIYTRVRNEQLQVAFGGTVSSFTRTSEPVRYLRTEEGKSHPLSRNLPDVFELDDHEVVWGDWQKDCTIHYVTASEQHTALVVSRSYWNGRLVWANSGDNGHTLAESISRPQEPFVRIIENAILWVSRRRQGAQSKTKQIVAHRGASLHAHENTLEAFEIAIGSNADYVELDVRKSADGVFVVHHDPEVADLRISSCVWQELADGARNRGYQLARLEDALKLCKNRIKLDIELKEMGYEKEVVDLIRSILDDREFVITSFNDDSLKTIKLLAPNVRCGLLLGLDKPRHIVLTRLRELFPVRRVLRIGADFVAPHHRLLRLGFSRRLRARGLPLWVWTADEPWLIADLFKNACVEAIITNASELALSMRKQTAEVTESR
jgi:glycerophosphoryl diester phosphodiesterase